MLSDTEDMEVENLYNSQLKSTDFQANANAGATTPPNTMDITFGMCLTPVSNNSPDADTEPSFIRRVGLDRVNRERSSSTPFHMLSKCSYSQPNSKQLINKQELSQWSSVDNHNLPERDPEQIMYEYVNPFTPDGKLFINRANTQKRLKRMHLSPVRKFTLTDSDSTDCDGEKSPIDSDSDVPTRHRLNELNVSRFNEEFVTLEQLGKGDHGFVFKCVNRINGCIYAVKKSIKPIKSSIEERIIRNEIYAHGILDHSNIVRNYSCWNEEGFVFIQNEYCNGGNFEDYIKISEMTEPLLYSLLSQMCQALRYVHMKGLAHLDVKPGNIFLCIEQSKESGDKASEAMANGKRSNEIIFKLGDFGHVAKLEEPQEVEEGDCRYLPREILEDKFSQLDRADIFALGLTVYEAAGAGPLPKNGETWHEIRNGNLKYLDRISQQFNDLLKSMVHPIPEQRPSAKQIIDMIQPIQPVASNSSEEFIGYIEQYRHNNKILEQKVEATGHYLKYLVQSHKQLQQHLAGKDRLGKGEKLMGVTKKKGAVIKNRIVGKMALRSNSTMF